MLILVAVALLVMYIYNFNNGLSNDSSDWDAFGSYFGAITGLLAFGGVLWSINDSNNQNKESSERDTFFKLLDLHTNKFSNVEYIGQSDNSPKAAEAFRLYTQAMNDYLKHIVMYKFILGEIDSGKTIEDIENLYYNGYRQPNNIIKNAVLRCDSTNSAKSIEELRKKIEDNNISLSQYDIGLLVQIALEEKPLSADELYEYSKKAADIFYHKYGHITGHYFRNLYYAMGMTSMFRSNNEYRKLLRAQISRYEIALNLYNALSSRSSVKMINLLTEYEIFDDQYKGDIYLLQIMPDGINIDELLQKSKEYLKDINRTGK